jgi:uncharacterized protein (TIGR03435 family)
MFKIGNGPNGFEAMNVTLRGMIQEAYGVQANQIEGPADLLDSTAYDVEAKTAHSEDSQLSFEQKRMASQQMLQSMLADKFKLVLHHESKALPSYVMSVGENGTKLQPSRISGENIDIHGSNGKPADANKMLMMNRDDGAGRTFAAQGISSRELAQNLSMQLATPVIDKTGLTGTYDFGMHWTADGNTQTSLVQAVQDQLGLKLEPQKTPMDVLVIDHVEKLAEN